MKDPNVSLWNSLINTLVLKCNRMKGMIKRYDGYEAPIITSCTVHLFAMTFNTVLQFGFH